MTRSFARITRIRNPICAQITTRPSVIFAPASTMKFIKTQADTTIEPRSMDTDHHGEDLYSFTRGRFVVNEEHEMTTRYKRFNAVELGKVAANALGSCECTKFEKYADGTCNRIFLLTMNDGKEAVAKVPLPTSGAPHYITASEVATSDYVRILSREAGHGNKANAR